MFDDMELDNDVSNSINFFNNCMMYSLISLKAIEELNMINCIYSVKTYRVKGGWGFEIYKGKELFVKREYSSLSVGRIPFLNKNEAEKFACTIIDEDRLENLSII